MSILFLSCLDKANALSHRLQFHQTITRNCMTVIFQLARLVEPAIPMKWRILLSGYLPDYLYGPGVIRTALPLAEVKQQVLVARQARMHDCPARSPSVRVRILLPSAR